MKRHDIIFVSFYTTKNRPFDKTAAPRLRALGITREEFSYSAHAAKLIASLKRFGLRYDIDQIAQPDWQAAVRSKPAFILRKMQKHQHSYKALVWIDADSQFVKDPHELFSLDTDLACRIIKRPRFQEFPKITEVHMGLLYVANNKVGMSVLQEWVNRMPAIGPSERCPEQECLYELLMDWRRRVRFTDLPERFAQPVGWGEQFAVCVQFQQSRYEREPEKLLARLDALAPIERHQWRKDPRLINKKAEARRRAKAKR